VVGAPIAADGTSSTEITRRLIRSSDSLRLRTEYHLLNQPEQGDGESDIYFPAIALPVEEKVEFECPEHHLIRLESKLKSVTKMLCIGWRAREMNFLAMVRKQIGKTVPVFVVAKDKEESSAIGSYLVKSGITDEPISYAGGFTDFVINRGGQEFLSK
jgi:hypothetical protein